MHMKIDILKKKFMYAEYTEKRIIEHHHELWFVINEIRYWFICSMRERRNRNICKKYDKNLH